ncbi:MAG: hypothetical protein RLY21_127 [Planctomycetota bacterium]|jgi:glycosyltransferase involved in cell wall biosynthesis
MNASDSQISIPPHIGQHLKRTLRLLSEGDHAGALEGIAAAALTDIQMAQQEFLGDVRGCAVIAECVRACIGGWAAAQSTEVARRRTSGPVRLLYVVSGLGRGQAASMNLVRLAEWHARIGDDGPRIEASVIVCEELTQRHPPLGYLGFEHLPTSANGAELLARLRKSCPVKILSTKGNFLDGAREGIAAARAIEADVAFFIGSPACAVQAAMAAARVAPAQACLNIGVPMLSLGIDAVIYNNRSKQARDEAIVRGCGIEVLGVATSGGDAQVGLKTAPVARREIGLPDGVPVAASFSNLLVRRMLAGTFARDLVAFLGRNPDFWWLGIGPCDPAPFHRLLEKVDGGADIRRRCVFAGGSAAPWGMIRSCQVLLNEYPEGGGNSVIETMGCGVPVVAMRAGARHAESIGAELVGSDAIETNDPDAYWSLAERWLRNPAEAQSAGARQRSRALAELDYSVICEQYERAAIELCEKRVRPTGSRTQFAAAS